jgi:hypothetical protein
MFGPLSIFGKDVLERDVFDLHARDDGQKPGSRARVETTRSALFLVRNRDKMKKGCETEPLKLPVLPTGGTGKLQVM